MSSSFRRTPAPRGYVPGLGRGAAGFTTRSDIGPMAATAASGESSGVGSRAAELRAAKLSAEQQFEDPNTNNETGEKEYDAEDEEADRIYDEIEKRMGERRRKRKTASEAEDGEETATTNSSSQARTTRTRIQSSNKLGNTLHQFRELKEKLADVTESEWDNIPDVGDYHKLKKHRKAGHFRSWGMGGEVFTPLPDSLLVAQSQQNVDASQRPSGLRNTQIIPGNATTSMSGLAEARGTVLGMSLDRAADGTTTSTEQTKKQALARGGGTHTTQSSLVQTGGTRTVDPAGYLTSLSSIPVASTAEVHDIHAARLLLRSVRDTNPHHGPGWIAAARVEEAAGQWAKARKIIAAGCAHCPTEEDVWLEAARLHDVSSTKEGEGSEEVTRAAATATYSSNTTTTASSVLAAAVRRLPTSVKLWTAAAERENTEQGKKAVYRKALEAIPNSVALWKAAVELERNDEDAKILLGVAVEKVPHAVEMWLALAKLETYDEARKVLNKARRNHPQERSVWMAAAKLEEAHYTHQITKDKDASDSSKDPAAVDRIVARAVVALDRSSDGAASRERWLTEAETCERAGAPHTAAAIVRHTIGKNIEDRDRVRVWSADATNCLSRGSVATARAILAFAITQLPHKTSLWTQAVDLEKSHGTPSSLDEVLAAASERLPKVVVWWLVRAKEKWLSGDIDGARDVLTQAFAANPESEPVWLAAAKLEWEVDQVERSRVLLGRARAAEGASSARVYLKSALLEWTCGSSDTDDPVYLDEALRLLDEGLSKYPTAPKLYMMAGQICRQRRMLGKARHYYRRGLERCPRNVVLWNLAARLEADEENSVSKARSLLELARLRIPNDPQLWLASIRLERDHRTGMADDLRSRALQQCPNADVLWADAVDFPSTEKKASRRSVTQDAVRRCPESPKVAAAVASLFAEERRLDKARKWFDRATVLDPDDGDAWSRYLAFERVLGTPERCSAVIERCTAADPHHGDRWCTVTKDIRSRQRQQQSTKKEERLDTAGFLDKVSRTFFEPRLRRVTGGVAAVVNVNGNGNQAAGTHTTDQGHDHDQSSIHENNHNAGERIQQPIKQ